MANTALSRRSFLGLSLAASAGALAGCSSPTASAAENNVTTVEVVCYKQEAVKIFEQFEAAFNETHDDVQVKISCPADCSTIIKTRFVREDYPDIIGIGADGDYASFVDSEILADVTDFSGMDRVQDSYKDIMDSVEYVPTDGLFGVPYVANAAGILYNRDIFDENGWEPPTTWDEFMDLCETIQATGLLPFYFGFLDTWTCLTPWDELVAELAPEDTVRQVNAGNATFTDAYDEAAEKYYQLLQYGESGPFAYGYNDACTAFARGQSAMYPIGSFAIPQILSVNPEMNIGTFAMPGPDNAEDRQLVSGVDLQWCVAASCPHKEAAYEVISFFMEPENVQTYIDDQTALPCVEGDFELPEELDGVIDLVESGHVLDFPDHGYPGSMSVDAQLQTYLINGDKDAFPAKFDSDWTRYNRDVIRKVQDYYASQS